MRTRIKTILPIALAAALELMPTLRLAVPVLSLELAPSAWAIVFQWVAGGIALFGYHAISSASSVTISPATANAGVPYSGTITYNGAHSYQIHGMSLTNICMDSPVQIFPGLYATCNGTNSATVTGTPTAPGNYPFTVQVWGCSPCSTGCGSCCADTRSTTFSVIGTPVEVVLSNLYQTYDGTAKSVGVITAPSNLTVAVTYNGLSSSPTNYGVYYVTATIVDTVYQGSTNATMMIGGWPSGLPNLEESFNFPSGQLGTNSPWVSASATGYALTSGGLTYPGFADLSPSGGKLQMTQTSASTYAFRSFSVPATNGSVYYSMLLGCSAVPVVGSFYIGGMLSSANPVPGGRTTDPITLVVSNQTGTSGAYRLAVGTRGDTSSVYATNILTINTANLVVLKFNMDDETASLFINPTPGAPEPATPSAVDYGTGQFGDLSYVYVRSATSSGSWTYDTLRIAPTWAAVTPASSGPSVQITGATGGVQLSWPVSSQNFQVLSANTPIGPWNSSGFTVLTNGSNATVTVPVTNQQQYFRLSGQ